MENKKITSAVKQMALYSNDLTPKQKKALIDMEIESEVNQVLDPYLAPAGYLPYKDKNYLISTNSFVNEMESVRVTSNLTHETKEIMLKSYTEEITKSLDRLTKAISSNGSELPFPSVDKMNVELKQMREHVQKIESKYSSLEKKMEEGRTAVIELSDENKVLKENYERAVEFINKEDSRIEGIQKRVWKMIGDYVNNTEQANQLRTAVGDFTPLFSGLPGTKKSQPQSGVKSSFFSTPTTLFKSFSSYFKSSPVVTPSGASEIDTERDTYATNLFCLLFLVSMAMNHPSKQTEKLKKVYTYEGNHSDNAFFLLSISRDILSNILTVLHYKNLDVFINKNADMLNKAEDLINKYRIKFGMKDESIFPSRTMTTQYKKEQDIKDIVGTQHGSETDIKDDTILVPIKPEKKEEEEEPLPDLEEEEEEVKEEEEEEVKEEEEEEDIKEEEEEVEEEEEEEEIEEEEGAKEEHKEVKDIEHIPHYEYELGGKNDADSFKKQFPVLKTTEEQETKLSEQSDEVEALKVNQNEYDGNVKKLVISDGIVINSIKLTKNASSVIKTERITTEPNANINDAMIDKVIEAFKNVLDDETTGHLNGIRKIKNNPNDQFNLLIYNNNEDSKEYKLKDINIGDFFSERFSNKFGDILDKEPTNNTHVSIKGNSKGKKGKPELLKVDNINDYIKYVSQKIYIVSRVITLQSSGGDIDKDLKNEYLVEFMSNMSLMTLCSFEFPRRFQTLPFIMGADYITTCVLYGLAVCYDRQKNEGLATNNLFGDLRSLHSYFLYYFKRMLYEHQRSVYFGFLYVLHNNADIKNDPNRLEPEFYHPILDVYKRLPSYIDARKSDKQVPEGNYLSEGLKKYWFDTYYRGLKFDTKEKQIRIETSENVLERDILNCILKSIYSDMVINVIFKEIFEDLDKDQF